MEQGKRLIGNKKPGGLEGNEELMVTDIVTGIKYVAEVDEFPIDIDNLEANETDDSLVLTPTTEGKTQWVALTEVYITDLDKYTQTEVDNLIASIESYKIASTSGNSFASFEPDGTNEHFTVKGTDVSLIAEFLDGFDNQIIEILPTQFRVHDSGGGYIFLSHTQSGNYGTLQTQGYLKVQSSTYTEFETLTDLVSGDAFSFKGLTNTRELVDTDGEQSWLSVQPNINQTLTAAYNAIKVDVLETSLGDGSTGEGNNLLNLAVGGASKFKVNNLGQAHIINGSAGGTAANSLAGDLVIEGSSSGVGMTIMNTNTGRGTIYFADQASNTVAGMSYEHNVNLLKFYSGTVEIFRATSFTSLALNPANRDTDISLNWDLGTALFTEGSSGYTAIGHSTPLSQLHTSNTIIGSAVEVTQGYFTPIINQSATAAYNAIKVNVTETTLGNGSSGNGNNLLNLAVAGTSLFRVQNNGLITVEGTTNYETLITHDDHIPNKKYGDDNWGGGGGMGLVVTTDNYVSTGSLGSLTTGDYNVAFGAGAGNAITTENSGIFLGHQSGYYSTAAQELYISSLTAAQQGSEALAKERAIIYGVQDAVTANQILYLNSAVGIRYGLVLDLDQNYGLTSALMFGNQDTGISEGADDYLQFETASSVAMTIDPSQNIGVGIATPNTKWTIKSAGASGLIMDIIRSGGTEQIFRVGEGSANQGYLHIGDNTTANLIQLNAGQNCWINTGTDFGLGTATPDELLHVYSSTDNTRVKIESTVALGDAELYLISPASGGISRIYFGDDVSETVGAITYLHNSDSMDFFTSGGSSDMNIASNGYINLPGVYAETDASAANVFVDTDGSLRRSTASSKRYKDNIDYESVTGLETFDLKPVRHTYKESHFSDTNTLFYGFIAEDIAKKYPELVSWDEKGRPNDVNYPKLTVILTKTIQNQQKEIKGLQNKVLSLESQVKNIISHLNLN